MEELLDFDVVLLCGISGSGKTTLARQLAKHGFVHLSLDGIMWDEFGDFAPDEFVKYRSRAESVLTDRLRVAVGSGQRVVVDATLCKRAKRDDYRRLLSELGASYRLVYCNADAATLRARLHRRNASPGREAALVTDEMLDRFLAGFEPPAGDEPHLALPAASERLV